MKLLYLLGAVIAVPLAWLVTTIYTIPELADFHSTAYLQRGEKASFSPMGHGLYKMQIFWHMTPFHAENLDMYLINEGKAWYLTDAGGFNSWLDPHADRIVQAVQETIPYEQSLVYVILTHSHLDHVGAIEPLKEVYPNLKVIVHETEAPFLIGGDEYSCYDYLPGGLSPGFKLLMQLRFIPPFYQYKIPKRWAYIARGESGDLSQLGVHDLTFTHTPGHCSGHVVYHHKPSGYLLAGDFTDVIQLEDGSYEIKTMCNSHTCNITQAHETICRVVHEMSPKLYLPYHDARKSGWTKEELIPMAEKYSQCSQRL